MRRVRLALLVLVPCGCAGEDAAEPGPDAVARAGAVPAAPAQPAPRPPRPRDLLLRVLPADTLACVHLPRLDSAWRQLEGTVFGALLSGIRVTDVARQLRPLYQAATVDQPPGAAAPASWTDFDRVLRSVDGEILVALLDLQGFGEPVPEVRALAGITVRGAGPSAAKVVDMLVSLAAAVQGLQLRKVGRVWVLRQGSSSAAIEVGVDSDIVLFGVGEGVVADGFKRMRRTKPDFRYHGTGSTFQEDDIARVHVHLAEVVARYGKVIPAAARKVIEAIRVDRWVGFSGAIRVDKQELIVRSFLDSPGGHDIVTRLLAANTVDYSILERLPIGLDSFTLFTFDPVWILRNLYSGLPPEQGSALRHAVDDLGVNGVDPGEPAHAVLGPQWAHLGLSRSRAPSTATAAIVASMTDSAWVVEIHDMAAVRGLIDRLSEQIPARRRYHIGLAEAVSYDLGFTIQPGIEFAPSFAITPSYLYVALSEGALRRALEPGTEKSARAYRQLLAGAPPKVSSVGYDSMQNPGMFANALSTALGESERGHAILPMAHKLHALHVAMTTLTPALAWTTADETGVTSWTRSPTGALSGVGGLTGIAIIAAIAIPRFIEARTAANESSAVATLTAIRSAQEQYRYSRFRDRDEDQVGEYGYLRDLMQPSKGGALLDRFPGVSGRYLQHGYIFRLFLPGRGGVPIGETGKSGEEIDANLSERLFIAVAWPVERGKTGNRSFILNTNGEIVSCAGGAYGGRLAPEPDVMCFERGNMVSRALEDGALARDGRYWYRVR